MEEFPYFHILGTTSKCSGPTCLPLYYGGEQKEKAAIEVDEDAATGTDTQGNIQTKPHRL